MRDSTRLVPHMGTSTVVIGMAFTGVTTDSLADKLGFANGDVILSVEEMPFTDPAHGLS